MKEYWKFDGMKYEGEDYVQYFEFEDGGVVRQINVNFFREGISYWDIRNREDWAEMNDRPLTDFYHTSMDPITQIEFEELWWKSSSR